MKSRCPDEQLKAVMREKNMTRTTRQMDDLANIDDLFEHFTSLIVQVFYTRDTNSAMLIVET